MGGLFANFEEYDVQATRRDEREKTIEDIKKLINIMKRLGCSIEVAKEQLMEAYNLTKEETEKKIALYW